MNRLFTRVMWTVAAVMACVVFAVTVSAGHASHAVSSARSPGVGAFVGDHGAAGGGAATLPRSDGSTR